MKTLRCPRCKSSTGPKYRSKTKDFRCSSCKWTGRKLEFSDVLRRE